MGRPKSDKNNERNKRVTIRFTDKELACIKAKAKEANVSISEYIREMVSKGKIEVHVDTGRSISDIKPLTEEFHKIGINLNQIAHHLNGKGEYTERLKRDLIKRADELRKLSDKTNDLLE